MPPCFSSLLSPIERLFLILLLPFLLQFVEDSNRTEGYDGPLPEQLENLCIDKEISCGFFRLRRAVLRQVHASRFRGCAA